MNKGLVPNYDLFFFEVETCPSMSLRTGSEVKMLHEMRPVEMGSMIVSTPVLARHRIEDLIRALAALRAGAHVESPYFRCISRDKSRTPLRYVWGEFRIFSLYRL